MSVFRTIFNFVHLRLFQAICLAAAAAMSPCAAAQSVAQPAVQPAADVVLLQAGRRAEPEVIETLRQLVLIESGSQHLPGLLQMADTVESRLKALGFATQRHKATTGVGADSVLGTLQGQGTQKILLMAHLDTVYPVGTLKAQPFKREGQRLYGPGIADDKGGVATILHGLKILADLGWRNKQWMTREGKSSGGHALRKCHLYPMLANPIYAGRIRAENEVVKADHAGIIDEKTFEIGRAHV